MRNYISIAKLNLLQWLVIRCRIPHLVTWGKWASRLIIIYYDVATILGCWRYTCGISADCIILLSKEQTNPYDGQHRKTQPPETSTPHRKLLVWVNALRVVVSRIFGRCRL